MKGNRGDRRWRGLGDWDRGQGRGVGGRTGGLGSTRNGCVSAVVRWRRDICDFTAGWTAFAWRFAD